MKKLFSICLATCIHFLASGQEKLVKDLDNDAIKDTVYIDSATARIICRLSTQNFIQVKSKAVDILNEQAGITATKNGFRFYNDWMRAGYKNDFRYDAKTKKIQLIGMSRYEFGNAMNDGSGESSVNLLTNNYIGNWNFFNEKKEKLISIPTIKTKMIFPAIYLESFNDDTYFDFANRCADLYEKHKDLLIKKEK